MGLACLLLSKINRINDDGFKVVELILLYEYFIIKLNGGLFIFKNIYNFLMI